jgi:hypothetical protein
MKDDLLGFAQRMKDDLLGFAARMKDDLLREPANGRTC